MLSIAENCETMKAKTWKIKEYGIALSELGIHTLPCWICHKKLSIDKATVDHVIPKSKGGKNIPSNYKIACKKCNVIKGNKILKRTGKPKRNWNENQRIN